MAEKEIKREKQKRTRGKSERREDGEAMKNKENKRGQKEK